MNWKLPNLLTISRIALAAVFFVLLGVYSPDSPMGPIFLNAAFVIYIIAGITDILDGYLARKMNVVSAFGRIADPFVDKLLVLGAFVMLAGMNFKIQPMPGGSFDDMLFEMNLPHWITGDMFTAVQPWMVVAILARELIISAVRGYSESCGIKFPATPAGKLKMFIQSFAICTILYQVANLPYTPWAIYLKISLVWLSVITTVLSGLAYMGQTRKLLINDEHP